MAKDLNKVILTGRLGKEVKVNVLQTGVTVATFSVASSRPIREGDGWREETEWFNVVAWRELAERAANRFSKGSRVLVEGRLQTRQYKDQNGQDRRITEVVASDIIGLDVKNRQEASDEDDWGTPSTASNRNSRGGSSGFDDDGMEPDDIPF